MEKAAKVMAWMLFVAGLLGLIVMAIHPDYRQLVRLLRKGTPEESAIWQSNLNYYPAVGPRSE